MPQMNEGTFYDLDPPAVIKGKVFRRVRCEDQVSNSSNEFVVKGIPQEGTETESFVLRFTSSGRVQPSLSPEQEF